ncbi:hypothetical protein C8Q70DRAFT_589034 [Cubamyces menziesii]|nr:hypothetical protein C8Q70DRAFT_589034 [Cubamyces menziesii]
MVNMGQAWIPQEEAARHNKKSHCRNPSRSPLGKSRRCARRPQSCLTSVPALNVCGDGALVARLEMPATSTAGTARRAKRKKGGNTALSMICCSVLSVLALEEMVVRDKPPQRTSLQLRAASTNCSARITMHARVHNRVYVPSLFSDKLNGQTTRMLTLVPFIMHMVVCGSAVIFVLARHIRMLRLTCKRSGFGTLLPKS